MKTTLTIILIFTMQLASWTELHAQQQYIMTQYMFNGLALNPAYAGSHESWSLTLMERNQWTGIEGAPTTQSLAVHGPINRAKDGSLGLLLISDKFGAIELKNFYSSYAYRMSFNGGKQHLSMGLQVGFSTFNVDFSNAQLIDPDDPALNGENLNSFLPNFGAGIYYNGQRFYAGLSLPYFVKNRLSQNDQDLSKQIRHYYLTLGSLIDLSHDLKFRPSLLVRYLNNVPMNIDLNASLIFNDIIWFGVTYRPQDSFGFLLELQFTDKLRFGYSFDLITSQLSAATAGSHEFVLNYRFKRKNNQIFHPRYF